MHSSHFWQSAGLLAIILGAAVLSAMIGSRVQAAATPHASVGVVQPLAVTSGNAHR